MYIPTTVCFIDNSFLIGGSVMGRLVSFLGLVFLLGLSSCATVGTVGTPSGGPELKVRLSPEEIQSRVLDRFASDWKLQTSDPLGFSIVKGLSETEAPTLLTGAERIRFNFVGAGEGVTQIRVVSTLVREGVETDTSEGAVGADIQEELEELFDSEEVDGP
jgi:hypothetical protein